MQITNIEKGYASIIKTRPEEEQMNFSTESTFIVSAADMIRCIFAIGKIENWSDSLSGVLFTNLETPHRDIYLLMRKEKDIELVPVDTAS